MTNTDKYVKALRQILNGANKVKYLWETPGVLEGDELLITRIIKQDKDYVHFGIKINEGGYLSLFHRADKDEEDKVQSIEEFAKEVSSRYSFVKPNHLKKDFLNKIKQPLERYETLIADAEGKAKQKLSFLESILS